MEQSFDDAADAVNQGGQSAGSEGPASVVYESREYPMIPEGTYKVISTKPKLRESKNPKVPAGTFNISIAWQTKEAEYKGDDDNMHKYLIFNRPLGIAFGDRANLPKVFKKLTGLDITQYVVETPIKIPLGNGKFKDAKRLTFDHTMLENMECELVVVHTEYEGKMYANIEAIICPAEQREKNAASLPPLADGSRPMPNAPAAEPKVEEKKEEGAAPATFAPVKTEEETEATKEQMRKDGFEI